VNVVENDYVRKVDGGYRVGGTRVSLDSVVSVFKQGLSPESIVDCYSALTLEQVYGAIAFYLRNQKEVDAYIEELDRREELAVQESRRKNGDLIARIKERARNASHISS